jgi:2-oxoglutarate ferredoxin oxidoreductase subunit alpha
MMDECVGHMIERVEIPSADKIEVTPRRMFTGSKENYLAYQPEADHVPSMVKAGDGFHIHVTGLTHDERGYPNMTVPTQGRLVRRLVDKIKLNADKIVEYKDDQVEGADIVVVTYGITSRTALPAIDQARSEGMKVGHMRLIVAWPFPEKRIRELAAKVKSFVVPELNFGQMVLEVERCAAGKANTLCVPHAGGTVHHPKDIYEAIRASVKGAK